MKQLAHIETVLFLKEVELFRYCTAEEIFRVAEIARERHYKAGEKVFEAGDGPEALCCVVDGRLELSSDGAESTHVGPGEVCGVGAILSGRLHLNSAEAEEDSLTLVIEAEDFFDLLSNNIEIVKALFRQLQPLTGPDRGALR